MSYVNDRGQTILVGDEAIKGFLEGIKRLREGGKGSGRHSTLYHGTTSDVLDKIKSQGLRPGMGGEIGEGSQKDAIYLSPDKDWAKNFASHKSKFTDGEPVVLEVRVPDQKIETDPEDPKGRIFRGSIPPANIKPLQEGGPGSGRKELPPGYKVEKISGDGLLQRGTGIRQAGHNWALTFPDGGRMKFKREESAHNFAHNHYGQKKESFRENRKLHYRTEFQGLPISIENRRKSIRRGGEGDDAWETKMKHPYGYIKGTEGVDGDALDVFVGPDEHAAFAYIAHCQTPDGKEFDEDKVMLGFSSKEDAERCFHQHYDDPKFFGGIDEIPMWKFREKVWVKKHTTKKLVASMREGGVGSGRHKEEIEKGGGKLIGEDEDLVHFHDPKTNNSYALRPGDVSAENVAKKIDKGREEVAGKKKYDLHPVLRDMMKRKQYESREGGPGSGPQFKSGSRADAAQPSKNYGPEFDQAQASHELERYKAILRNPRANAATKKIAQQRIDEHATVMKREAKYKGFLEGGPGSGRHSWASVPKDEEVHFNSGPMSVEAFRTGPLKDSGRGIFFGNNSKGVEPYASNHEDAPVKKYSIEAKNVAVAPSMIALYAKLYPGKTFQDAVWRADKKSGFKDSITASAKVEARMASKVRAMGHDAIVYTRPPAPAEHEITIIGKKPSITEVKEARESQYKTFLREAGKRFKLYYSRPMDRYGSESEANDLALISEAFPDADIVMPKTKRHAELGMGHFHKQINKTRRVIIKPTRKNRLTTGTWSEARHALKRKIPVYGIRNGRIREVKSVKVLNNPNQEGHFGRLVYKKEKK